MPTLQETLPAGTNFTGAIGAGLVQLTYNLPPNDGERWILRSLWVSAAAGTLATLIVRAGPAGLLVTDLGYVEYLNSTSAIGAGVLPNIVVPYNFQVFVYTTEAAPGEKRLVADYQRAPQ